MDFETDELLNPPDEFSFPFTPYAIQVDFMKSLYKAIEERKIGIFESPTGTGKSLSLVCGTLTWLRDHEKRVNKKIERILSAEHTSSENTAAISSLDDGNEPLWVKEFAQKQQANDEVKTAKRLKLLRQKRDKYVAETNASKQSFEWKKRGKYVKRKREDDDDETLSLMQRAKKEVEDYETNQDRREDDDATDLEFALEDYESDDEKNEISKRNNEEEVVEEGNGITQVFFCSRTHSQLSQFIRELQKTKFRNSISDSNDFQVSMATVASRNTLCINNSVKKLGILQQINEKCLEMQKNSRKKTNNDEPKTRRKTSSTKATCCYYGNGDKMSQLTSTIVSNVIDIEDMVKEGLSVGACPYYAARRALPYSHLVVLPYQSLLHEATRLASGINIKDSVIIIDEAHNLVEAINSMHSCQISAKEIAKAIDQVSQYCQKFNKRLKAKNLYYVKQIIYVLRNLLSVMAVTTTTSISTKGEASQQRSSETSLFTLSDFLFKSSLDNINLYKLLRYCSRSKISLKLNGFVEKCEVSLNDSAKKSSLTKFLQEIKNPVSTRDNAHLESPNKVMSRSPLMHIESFLWSLTSSSKDGRIVVTTGTDPTLKFLLLNPASHFKKILDECRSLIVAGGTMQPSSSMIDQLIGRPEPIDHRLRIVEFSCGHVIDGASQLLPLVLGSGPSNEVFRFTFEKRASAKLITELGRMLLNMINVIPGGVVCFFPSYEYENLVYDQWLKEGLTTRMELRKKIFREPKKSNQVDQLLAEYAKCIERTSASAGRQSGAILLSVVGGKMSEGINFSDDLGRCIVMVGLPYPNMHSPELKEKIAYLNTNMPPHSDGRTAGQVYYESLCMKAVNQSIGRAIRHRNDYACLLLVDSRYSKPSVAHKLPEWIGKHLKAVSGFGQAFSAVRKFFNDKKT